MSKELDTALPTDRAADPSGSNPQAVSSIASIPSAAALIRIGQSLANVWHSFDGRDDYSNNDFLEALGHAAATAACEMQALLSFPNPDNTYTPYGRRSVRNLAELLGLAPTNPTVVTVINGAYDEIVFLRALIRDSDDSAVRQDAPEGQHDMGLTNHAGERK